MSDDNKSTEEMCTLPQTAGESESKCCTCSKEGSFNCKFPHPCRHCYSYHDGVSCYAHAQGKTPKDKREGKVWVSSYKGSPHAMCDECCNGDRCDDPTHFDRSSCPFCLGSAYNKTAEQMNAVTKLPAPTAEAAQPQDALDRPIIVDGDYVYGTKPPAQEAVEEPLPPLTLTHEDNLKAIRNAGFEMGGNRADELSCRERQLREALALSAARLKALTEASTERDKWEKLRDKAVDELLAANARIGQVEADRNEWMQKEISEVNGRHLCEIKLAKAEARIAELEAQAGLLKIKYLLTDAMLPDDFDPDLEPLDRLTQWFTQNEPPAQEEEQKP
jgi:hypothetical protein